MIKKINILLFLLILVGCSKNEKKAEEPVKETTAEWMGDKAQDRQEVQSPKQEPKEQTERIVQTEQRPIQSKIDSVRSHLQDSAAQARDSMRLLREKELEAEKKAKKQKVEFINRVYKDMWVDGQNALDYLSANRTATQVRSEAQNYITKSSRIRGQMMEFEDGDPRKKALSDHLNLVELLATRLPQTDGIKRKMDILRGDVTENLNKVANQGDIIID